MVWSVRVEGGEGDQQTLVFFVEELSLALCESTSDDELVCEFGVRFADCSNGDVIAGGDRRYQRAGEVGRSKTTNMHSLAPFTESFLIR